MTNADIRSIFVESTYHIKVQCFPNNEIAIRLKPWVKSKGDDVIDRFNRFTALQLENGAKTGTEKCILGTKEDIKEKEEREKTGWGILPKKREFNKKVQQGILRRVAAIQAKYGRQAMRFLTVTLPGSTEAAMRAMAQYSAYIVNRINRFFSNIIGSDAQNRVQVWEFQKRRALHSHIAIASKNQEGLKRIDKEFQGFCHRMFQDISKMSGIDMFERKNGTTWKDRPDMLRCDSQVVKSNACAYMSKYMGKGEGKGHNDATSGVYYYPSLWGTWGRGATKAMYQRTWRLKDRRIDAETAEKVCLKAIECSEKYSQEKYRQPLIYLDKVGYGVNIKTYVKPEYIEDYMDEIKGILLVSEVAKNPLNNIQLVSMDVVYKNMLDEAYSDLMEHEMRQKYGDSDPRRWQKVFRNNLAPIPVNASDESWREFYSRC